jgi:hypothetical protein
MTLQPYYSGGYGEPAFTYQDFENQYARRQKLASKVAWWNPKEDAIYVSDNDKTPNYPPGNCVIPKLANVRKARELKAQGKLREQDSFNIYNKHDGWQDMANEYRSSMKARTAGVMAPSDFTGIEVTNVLSTLLGLPERNYVLQDAATVVPSPYLDVRVDTWSGFDVSEDIKIGAEIPTGQGTFSSTTYTLKLNAAHIARYDELDMRPHYWDIWRQNLENVARRMVKKKATLIGAELETATTETGGADWGVVSSGLSSNNPLDQLGKAADTIIANDGNPNTIALSDKAYRDLITNTFMKGTAQNFNALVGQPTPGAAKTVNVPGLSYQFYVDNLITATLAIIYDKAAITAFQGPTSTAMYRDAIHRFDGYITTDYFLVDITQAGKIRQLTAVTA